MRTRSITFKNIPTANGFQTITIEGCTIGNYGSPNTNRPKVIINLPKTDSHDVDGSFVNWDGYDYHVVGTSAVNMSENTPTPWNRYAIAERIIAL